MANGNFAGGDGTEQNPYLIEDAFDLDAMRNNLTAHYKLVNDIDLDIAPFNEGQGWEPIGTSGSGNQFSGRFDGDGFSILNLYINRSGQDYVGLFGVCSNGAIISNVMVKSVNVVGGNYVGGLTGYATGSTQLNKSFVSGQVQGVRYVGGVLGRLNSSSKAYCLCFDGGVEASEHEVGGVIGDASNGSEVNSCYSWGMVVGGNYTGGLIGRVGGSSSNQYVTVRNSYSISSVSSRASSVGGLIGLVGSGSSVVNSYWDIETSGQTTSAGGVGKTTAEMKDPQTFIDAGWDTTIWYLVEGEYPRLAHLLEFNNKIFVVHNSQYKYYDGAEWRTLNEPPTEQDYIDYGMDVDFVSGLSTSAWIELDGEVELHFYTDDERVSESTLTIHTEPFDLYEELGSSVEILYYTEDSSITEPKLIIEANYSPLDELEGDFEVVTWTEDEDAEPKIQMTALPNPRVVIPLQSLNIVSDLQKLTLNTTIDDEDYGVVRVAASGDGGQTWKSFKNGNWIDVELIGQDKIRYYWMSPEDIESITGEEWRQLNSDQNIRLAYYIRQDDIDLTVKIDSLVSNEIATIETPTLSSLTIVYNELDRKYSGLMFMDTTQEYYSTSFGEIIKYLDMGTLIAGQTSFDINVKLTNTYPFDVRNIFVWSEHDIEGLTVELSKSNNPFIPEKSLLFEQVLRFDEVIDFYVRLKVDSIAEKGGNFDIKVSAEQV